MMTFLPLIYLLYYLISIFSFDYQIQMILKINMSGRNDSILLMAYSSDRPYSPFEDILILVTHSEDLLVQT